MTFNITPQRLWKSVIWRAIFTVFLSGGAVIGRGQPATETVVAGTTLTLIATADGYPAPTFQWQKNGSAISGATGSLFVLANVTAADAASYRVLASNSAGSALSDEFTLVVNAAPPTPPPSSPDVAPVIQVQPLASQTVVTGAPITLSVSATGIPAPSYQWRRNGQPISGATSHTLSLSSAVVSDAGTYTVVVSNAAGSVVSNSAVVTVNAPPAITVQPASNVTAAAGDTVTLSVVATGSPAPTYQWRKNGQAIPGATTAALSLNSVTQGDSGSYTVMVTNPGGSISSNSSSVTVSAPGVTPPPPPPPTSVDSAPVITTQPPATQTVVAGSEVKLSVTASGTPAPSFQWRKNGQAIAGATNSTLTLASAKSGDAGTYSAVVANRVGTVVSTSVVLSVNVPPAFTTQPNSHAGIAATMVTLSVAVSGIPGPTLQWQKDGAAIPGATSANLVLSSLRAEDTGVYSVIASNEAGSVISNNAYVVIGASPQITRQPASQTVGTGSTASFTVVATGSPAPAFQWKKNGIDIAGATSGTLTLRNVAKSDEAVYSVEARNSVGWVVSSGATLSVNTSSGQSNSGGSTPPPTAPDLSDTSRVVNLSVRSGAGTGNEGLIVGFVVSGGNSKSLLLRGVGPTLGAFGVPDALNDPTLSLYSGTNLRASNDDWGRSENAAAIATTSERLGAFGLPNTAADAALMATLEGGAYTLQVSGKESRAGVALVEVYDATATASARLVNLSVRTHVGVGISAPNIGFVIAGNSPKRLLLRASGPALVPFGVSDVLANPQIEIFSGTSRVHYNDNWEGKAELNTTFAQVGAFGFPDGSSKDAAVVVTLQPGAYTAVVSGVGSGTGVALVEVYELP